MAADRSLALKAVLVFAALGGLVSLASAEQPAAGDQFMAEGSNYYFKQGVDGRIEFTQVLRWETDSDALEYRFILRAKGDSSGRPAGRRACFQGGGEREAHARRLRVQNRYLQPLR